MIDVFNIEKLTHLSLKNKLGLKVYPWRKIKLYNTNTKYKPLHKSKIAIITTAGFSIKNNQPPFDENVRGGDWSYRKIPNTVKKDELIENHRSSTFDHFGIVENPFSVLPIPHLKSLLDDNLIGSVNHRHFSVMGSITAPGRFIKQTIPKIVEKCIQDNIDLVLLIPV